MKITILLIIYYFHRIYSKRILESTNFCCKMTRTKKKTIFTAVIYKNHYYALLIAFVMSFFTHCECELQI